MPIALRHSSALIPPTHGAFELVLPHSPKVLTSQDNSCNPRRHTAAFAEYHICQRACSSSPSSRVCTSFSTAAAPILSSRRSPGALHSLACPPQLKSHPSPAPAKSFADLRLGSFILIRRQAERSAEARAHGRDKQISEFTKKGLQNLGKPWVSDQQEPRQRTLFRVAVPCGKQAS